MKTEEKIEMTRKNLMSVSGYSFDENKVREICEANEYIPDGSMIMNNGDETVFFENENFVTRNKDGEIVKCFVKTAMSEEQLLQLFAIWASKNI